MSGSITGNSSLTKTGTCLVVLSGSSSYSGGTYLNAGTLVIGNTNAFGTGALTFGGTSGILIPTYGNYPTLTNSVVVPAAVTGQVNVINQYYKITFTGPLSGGGTLYVNDSDSSSGGIATFSNPSNTFTGTVQIGQNSVGQLNLGSLPDSPNPIQFLSSNNGGGILQLTSGTAVPLVFNQRQVQLISSNNKNIAATILNANATATNTITINTDLSVSTTGTKTLTFGGANTGSNAFTGKISDGAGGALSLVKQDAGLWVIAGSNTYSGTTTISGGVLQVGNGSPTGTLGSGNVTDNARLVFNRSDTLTVTNAIGGTGQLSQNGVGTLVLTGNNTYTGITAVTAGTLLYNGSLAPAPVPSPSPVAPLWRHRHDQRHCHHQQRRDTLPRPRHRHTHSEQPDPE